jgi:hypothetical protein
MKRTVFCLAALLAVATSAQAGGIVVPAEQRYSPYSGELPACDDPGVLADVSSRFADRESGAWNSPLRIAGYHTVKELGLRSNGLDYIPRRYCLARAFGDDSRRFTVVYQLQEDLGPIGFGYGLEWCVVGLDRTLAYAPKCGALRPFVENELGQSVLRARY